MSSLWTLLTGFSGENDSMQTRLRKSVLLLAALCFGFSLSACGDSSRSQSGPSPPSTTSATSGGSTATPALDPIIAPPGSDERPLQPGSLGRPIASDGLPALQPPKGIHVSVDTLFADDIKDPIERSKRLETAVVEMRRDLDAAMPAIKRLVAIEQDIQLLSSQLETLLNSEEAPVFEKQVLSEPVSITPAVMETTTAPPSPVSEPEIAVNETGPPLAEVPSPEPPPEPVPITPQVATPPPAAPPVVTPPAVAKTAVPSGAPAVLGLRLGEHPGKTRLVVDMSGPSSFRTDIDNAEKILIVEIDKAAWAGTVGEVTSSPLVQSYTVQPLNGTGTRIIIVLKTTASVAHEDILAPDTGSGNTRLVIDLAH